MDLSKTLSVFMPVYNSEQYLHDSISSVLAQTYNDFTFIIVNDGSTDNSQAIIKEYADRDKRILFLNKEHNYLETLNWGIKIAIKSEFVARMDADDKMRPIRLERQLQFMQEHKDIAACGSWFQTFGQEEEIYRPPLFNEEIDICLLKYNPLANPTTIIRSSCLKYILKYHTHIYDPLYSFAEDYNLWYLLNHYGFKMSNIPEVLLDYRISYTQVSRLKAFEMQSTSYDIQCNKLNDTIRICTEQLPESSIFWSQLVTLANNKKISFESLIDIASIMHQEIFTLKN